MRITPIKQKPKWLTRRLPTGPAFENIRGMVRDGNLHTVCQEAKCPNMWECFSKKTATFLIMGPRCTRTCGFCAVEHGPLHPLNKEEPLRVAQAVLEMGLAFAVVTSVTRDDLVDGGAAHFAETIRQIRQTNPGIGVEVLIPDFLGDPQALETLLGAAPDVLNHNIETVPRLYSKVRPEAMYDRSLDVFRRAAIFAPHIPLKSGIMLGLGEDEAEVLAVLKDLVKAGCSLLTIGQYLQPSSVHLAVQRYISPEEFDEWAQKAQKIGFKRVAAGPFVRSSYEAHALVDGKKGHIK
ncbi:lipoyl synthase [Desulfobacterales bacterium HSG17]|nr:lipoyl synthase [Desulfobacterales bacterium HSG17]